MIKSDKKLISCVTGSRAEYSRIKSVFKAISKSPKLDLKVIVSGAHLLYRYGATIKDIENDGYDIYATCFVIVEGENPVTMAKSVGLAISEFSTVLHNLKPDLLLVMGDRYDALAAAIAGAFLNIPIAHIQGGEVSGSIDESIRHVITKFSHIHLPSTEQSKEFIIRMGEDPDMVFNVGCPSVDIIKNINIMPRDELFSNPLLQRDMQKKFYPNMPYILCFFHPVTTSWERSYEDTMKLLTALNELEVQTIYLYPNVDAGSEDVIKSIRRFFLQNNIEHVELYKHFPFEFFISIMANADCMVGNSSAGIREACYFGTPVVNIGNRQQYRERSKNVIDIGCETEDIKKTILFQLQNGRYEKVNLYGDGDSGKRIVKILEDTHITNVQKVLTYCKEPLTKVYEE